MNFTFPTNAGKKKKPFGLSKAQRIVIFHKHYRSNDFPNFEGSKKRECEASCPRLLSVHISQSSLTGNRFLKASLNLTVQGTLKSLLQHHSSKAVLWRSAFFMDQLSHPYMTTGETIALTTWTFVSKVTSVLFDMLSRFVIAFLPRSERLLISWLQSSSAVILEPKKMKSVSVSIVSPSICHEVIGPDAMIFVFWMLSFKPSFSLSSFTFIRRLFGSLLSTIKVVVSAYLRLLTFLPVVLIPASTSPSPAFLHDVLCIYVK